jgi:hypothetical protein
LGYTLKITLKSESYLERVIGIEPTLFRGRSSVIHSRA